MTLDKLQVHLLEVTEIQVLPAMIWRTLQRLGYTMKTVSLLLSSPSTYSNCIIYRSHVRPLNKTKTSMSNTK